MIRTLLTRFDISQYIIPPSLPLVKCIFLCHCEPRCNRGVAISFARPEPVEGTFLISAACPEPVEGSFPNLSGIQSPHPLAPPLLERRGGRKERGACPLFNSPFTGIIVPLVKGGVRRISHCPCPSSTLPGSASARGAPAPLNNTSPLQPIISPLFRCFWLERGLRGEA